MFWYLLNRAGLIQETDADLRNDGTLKRIYDRKFQQVYGLNLVNLIDRPTVDVTTLKKGEEQAGIGRALGIIRRYQPRVVCFIGKITFTTFGGSARANWGWQTDMGASRAYLMHFPIRGPAAVRVKELRAMKRAAEGIV